MAEEAPSMVTAKTLPGYVKRVSSGAEVFVLYEGNYDVLPGFCYDEGFGLNTPNLDPAMRAKYMTADGTRMRDFQFGCSLVRLPNGTNILLDTAMGTKELPGIVPCTPPFQLMDSLSKLQVSPEDIHIVVHSHLHWDHIGGNVVNGQMGFPNAIHYVHKGEWDYAQFPESPWHGAIEGNFGPIQAAGRLKFLEGNETLLDAQLAPDVTAILTDGHTPGHVCIRIGGGGQPLYYIGDSMHLPVQVEHPEWTPFFDCCQWPEKPKSEYLAGFTQKAWTPNMRAAYGKGWHARTSEEKRKAILQRIAKENALLVSPHFPAPGMGTVVMGSGGRFEYRPLDAKNLMLPNIDAFGCKDVAPTVQRRKRDVLYRALRGVFGSRALCCIEGQP